MKNAKIFLYFLLIVMPLFLFGVSLENEFYNLMDFKSKEFKNKYSSQTNNNSLEILKNMYLKNKPKISSTNKKAKIPNVIHQIWVGPNPKPKFFEVFAKTWIEKNPGWQYKLWTNKEVKKLKLFNRKLYENASHPREQANILRYEILYQFGGLYVDADFLCLESFDKFSGCDFYVGIAPNDTKTIVNNALIAATPGHPIMGHIVHNIRNKVKDAMNRSGVWYFSRELIKVITSAPGVNIALPTNYFYCVPKNNGNFNSKNDLFKFVKPESMALHYWATYWHNEIENLMNKIKAK